MKLRLCIIALGCALASTSSFAQSTCPWAGGEYRFSDSGIYGDFSVNTDCTELVWDRLNAPETTALKAEDNGWSGELSKVAVVLLPDGEHLQVTAYGGISRKSKTKRTN